MRFLLFLYLSLLFTHDSKAGTSGFYIGDSGISIELKFHENGLTLIEPNNGKVSNYKKIGDDEVYHFYSEKMDTTYAVRVLDRSSISVFKPKLSDGRQINGDTFRYRLIRAAPNTSSTSDDISPSESLLDAPSLNKEGRLRSQPDTSKSTQSELAQKYLNLRDRDPDSVQVWTFCAAVANYRQNSDKDLGEAFALKAARSLQLITTDKDRSPCPDAIPSRLWKRASKYNEVLGKPTIDNVSQ